MNQIAAMRIFVRVAECLNFTATAKDLGVSTAVVTRNIAALEEHLHTRLINRTTRSVSLTAPGKAYWEACAQLLKQLDSVEDTIASTTKQSAGPLKIAATASYAASELPQLIAAYHLIEPKATFEVSVFESTSPVVSNDFDVCFIAERRLRDSSLVCRALQPLREVVVASPRYIERAGAPLRPEQLERHDILLTSNTSARHWEFRDRSEIRRVPVKPFVSSMTVAATKAALLAGLGIARLPLVLVQSELDEGELRPVLQNYSLNDDNRIVWMVYSSQRLMPVAVRSFIDFVVSRYRATTSKVAA
jgi:DNA-binding transcriptional LysR family regulator